MDMSHERSRRNNLTIVRWSRKPGEHPVVRFVMLSIYGLLLCLFLMIFMPGLRGFGAVALFMVIFPAILTAPTVSSRRAFMRGLTGRVNDIIAEVTETPGGQLSVREFRRLFKTGERLPLAVSGVPGLSLQVQRIAPAEKNSPETWRAVFTVVPPENGTASFDRLVAAAIDAGPGSSDTAS
jgi:uncharacterized protein (DUF58 family)